MILVDYKNRKLHIGDTLRVKNTISEGDKTRIQTFEGILIAMSGRGENKTFTVRKIGDRGIGVERIWPLNSRNIVDIEVKKKGANVRRSKLYYMRHLTGKSAVRV